MVQVVTSENLVEFIQTGKVEEFKPPEAKTEEAKEEAKADAKTDDAPSKNENKLQEKDSGDNVKATDKTVEDDEDANLPERVRRQIAKKHRAQKEAEEFARVRDREAAVEKSRADGLQRELESLKNPKKSEGPVGEEPNSDDFKTVGEYTRALTKYEVKKAADEAGEQSRRQGAEVRQKQAADSQVQAFIERQAEFIKANPDYKDTVEEADLNMPNIALQYFVESEVGPELVLYFAKNPSDAERLKKLSPTRVIAEIGKIEAKIEATKPTKEAAQPKINVSKAPAPVQSLNGDSASAVQKDPSKMTFQELRSFRIAERNKRAV